MSLEVWIYAKPAEWTALTPVEGTFSHAHANAKTGYWKTYTGGYEVYNTVGSVQDIQDIKDVGESHLVRIQLEVKGSNGAARAEITPIVGQFGVQR